MYIAESHHLSLTFHWWSNGRDVSLLPPAASPLILAFPATSCHASDLKRTESLFPVTHEDQKADPALSANFLLSLPTANWSWSARSRSWWSWRCTSWPVEPTRSHRRNRSRSRPPPTSRQSTATPTTSASRAFWKQKRSWRRLGRTLRMQLAITT